MALSHREGAANGVIPTSVVGRFPRGYVENRSPLVSRGYHVQSALHQGAVAPLGGSGNRPSYFRAF